MAVFGIDVSRYQTGIDLRELPVDFVMAKVSEGSGWKDPQFDVYREQVGGTDLLFAGYHFLRGDSPPGDQARNVKAALGDSGIPVIIDIERTNGVPQPKMADVRLFRDVAVNLGVNVANLLYLPEWYWTEIGRPDTGGWDIWQSNYGSNDGVYPGDQSDRWIAMGRQAAVLQYTSTGRLPGYSGDLDINAFRGTREELAQKGWFYDFKEHEVATKSEIQAWVASTPIKINTDGTVWPLQQVLRRLLAVANTPEAVVDVPTAEEVAAVVLQGLPADVDLTKEDVRAALEDYFRSRFGS